MKTPLLSPLDDYLVHQVPEPVRCAGTTDRNFYDRYYFCLYAESLDCFAVLGLGQYPNLGTQDAFITFRQGDVQRTLRSSRLLGDRHDNAVGPISVDVLEGLRRLRLRVDDNALGIRADLVFCGAHVPQVEPRQIQRHDAGGVIHDVTRYCQTGHCEGFLALPGRRLDSSAERLFGYRDRSWGIRPIGRPDTDRAHAADGHQRSGLFGTTDWRRLHLAAQFEGFTINVKLHENASGERYIEDAVRVWHGDARYERLGRPHLEFRRFSADRRFAEEAVLTFRQADGAVQALTVLAQVPLYLEAGTGYGNRKELDWIHGQFRGEAVTDDLSFDLNLADVRLAGPIDCLAQMHFEGHRGHGLFEYTIFGAVDGFPGPGHFNALRAVGG